MPRRTRGAGVTIPAPAAAAANGNAATAHRVRATPLVRHAVIGRPEAAQGRLERPQAAADDLGLPRAGTSGSALGVHCGTHRLERGEHVSDPSAVFLIRAASRIAYSVCVRS